MGLQLDGINEVTGVPQSEMGTALADTSMPSLPVSPNSGPCIGLFLAHFASDVTHFTTTVRYAEGHNPNDPNPHAPPPTLRNHEFRHVEYLKNYLDSVDNLLASIRATKCVCWSCFLAKKNYFDSMNWYYFEEMRANNYQFDCSQYGQWCDAAQDAQKLASTYATMASKAKADYQKACQ